MNCFFQEEMNRGGPRRGSLLSSTIIPTFGPYHQNPVYHDSLAISDMLIVFLALNIYLFIRGWQAIPDKKVIHTIYSVIFVFSSLSIFVAIFAGRILPAWMGFVFEHVGGYWMILFVYMIAFTLFGDLLRITNHFFHIFPAAVTANMPMTRLLYFFGVLGALALLSLIGFFRFSHPRVKELSISYQPGY